MAKIVEIYFDGDLKECLVQTDQNGEYVCTARDGQFVKFPKGVDLDQAIVLHNNDESNVIKPDAPEDVEAKKQELAEWLTEVPASEPAPEA